MDAADVRDQEPSRAALSSKPLQTRGTEVACRSGPLDDVMDASCSDVSAGFRSLRDGPFARVMTLGHELLLTRPGPDPRTGTGRRVLGLPGRSL